MADRADAEAGGRAQALRRPRGAARGSTSRSARARSSACSAPAARARARCCAASTCSSRPEEGEILLEGKSICRARARRGREGRELDFVRQRVGMVFQQFNLFPHKTRARERHDGAAGPCSGAARPRPGQGRRAAATASASPTSSTSTRTASRAASSSGSRSPGRWRWTRGDAVRRGHQRARPRAGQGGARRDARARRRGHDDARRHPRDGLRPRGRRPGRVHGRGRRRRAGRPEGRARRRPSRSAPSASSGWCSSTEPAD